MDMFENIFYVATHIVCIVVILKYIRLIAIYVDCATAHISRQVSNSFCITGSKLCSQKYFFVLFTTGKIYHAIFFNDCEGVVIRGNAGVLVCGRSGHTN